MNESLRVAHSRMRGALTVSGLALMMIVGSAGLCPRPLHAFNTQNPRWQSLDRYPPRQSNKPYRPLHLPPSELPTRQHIGGFKVTAEEMALIGMVALVAIVVGAQWLAAWTGLPVALWLLGFGAAVGPVTGLVNPDILFGNLLLPLVSIGIATLLFLDGLAAGHLRSRVRRALAVRLATVGMVVTCVCGTVAASWLFDLGMPAAVLLALTLSMLAGPDAKRPGTDLHAAAADEGLVVRVVGPALIMAALAGISRGGFRGFGPASWTAARDSLLYGLLFGAGSGALLVALLRQSWIARGLGRTLLPSVVLVVFALTDIAQPGSGFTAVIAMGVLLSAQKVIAAEDVARLRRQVYESLSAVVMLLLVARVSPDDFLNLGVADALFVAVMVVIARPLAVAVATLGGGFNWRERLLLSVIAPRGVLALGLATLCGLRLAERGNEAVATWIPLTVLVSAGSMVAYALVLLLVRTPQVTGVHEEDPDQARWPSPARG